MRDKQKQNCEETDEENSSPEVPEEHSFVVIGGEKLNSLIDLAAYIRDLPEEKFDDFLEDNKHEVADWVRNTHGEEKLADAIIEENKQKIKKKLDSQLKELDELEEEAKTLMECQKTEKRNKLEKKKSKN